MKTLLLLACLGLLIQACSEDTDELREAVVLRRDRIAAQKENWLSQSYREHYRIYINDSRFMGKTHIYLPKDIWQELREGDIIYLAGNKWPWSGRYVDYKAKE